MIKRRRGSAARPGRHSNRASKMCHWPSI